MIDWKFDIGDIVEHKLTHDHLLILEYVTIESNGPVPGYIVRDHDYQRSSFFEFELKEISN